MSAGGSGGSKSSGGTGGSSPVGGSGGSISHGGSAGTGGSSPVGGSGGSISHGGSAGTGGSGNGGTTGGGSGTGGGGTGGSETTPCPVQPNGAAVTAEYTVSLDGGTTETLGADSCYVSTAYYYANDDNANCAFDAASNDGFVTVSFLIEPTPDAGAGYVIGPGVALSQQTIPMAYQGEYVLADSLEPIDTSCVSFTTFKMMNGGEIAGSMDCTFVGGNDTTDHTAHVTGTFDCHFAP
jgi:hypothetical protein